MAAVRERLGRFFGKGGDAVVDANLEVISAAFDGVIDVTGALGLPGPPDTENSSPATGRIPEGATP